MDLKQLDIKAQQDETMPAMLNAYEQAYYIACRGLYQQYADKKITLAQARGEKDMVLREYKQQKRQFDFCLKLYSIANKLQELKQTGFNSAIEWEVLEEIEKVIEKG